MSDNVIAFIAHQKQAAEAAFAELKETKIAGGALYGAVLIDTDANAKPTVREEYDPLNSVGAVAGGLLGGLVGVLGGPVGLLIGGGAGALLGNAGEGEADSATNTAIALLAEKIGPNLSAVLALATEENEAQLDKLGSQHGALVVRSKAADLLSDVTELKNAEDNAAYEKYKNDWNQQGAELQKKAENAWSELKAKLNVK